MLDSSVGTVSLQGTRGFTLEAITLAGVDPASVCEPAAECPPGKAVPLSGMWAGLDLPGIATLQGQTYTDVGGINSPASARIELPSKGSREVAVADDEGEICMEVLSCV